MKNTQQLIRLAVIAGALTTAGWTEAQTSVMTSVTSSGTVSDVTPGVLTVRTNSAIAPVNYSYSKTMSCVDEDGNTVSVETVRSGAPVTVHYSQDGERRVALKVIVHRSILDGTTLTRSSTTSTTSTTVTQ